MQEIELKFQIPQSSLKAVAAEIASMSSYSQEHLQAHYFDTPERKLGQARSALRLRKEGSLWVQTLKAAGENAMTRVEDNQEVAAPAQGEAAQVDLSRHHHPQVQAALVHALGWDHVGDPMGKHTGLVELYRTDILRHRARQVMGSCSLTSGEVELALDLGEIQADSLSVPVCELEIELIAGHPLAVIEAAREWVNRHGLWLDTQTKAHRGNRLARQAENPNHQPMPGAHAGLEGLTDLLSEIASTPGLDHSTTRAILVSVLSQMDPNSGNSTHPAHQLLSSLQTATSLQDFARAPQTSLSCLDMLAELFTPSTDVRG